MFIDQEKNKDTHSVRSAMYVRSITKALALVIYRHCTPKRSAGAAIRRRAINIALLPECKHRLLVLTA